VVANELFVNLYNGNRNGLRFIIGHELGHIRFHHVALWYQIAVAYSQVIPVLGPTLSRLREYSCDRQGAALTPQGATGLVLLASSLHGELRRHRRAASPRPAVARFLGGTHADAALAPVHRAAPERLYRLGLFERTAPDTVGPSAVRPRDAAST
jgi:Zn-dependent protease with chaperone function